MKPYPNEELDRMSKREIIRLYKRTVEQFNDAEPVRHGKWIHTGRLNIYGGTELECDQCHDKVMVQHPEDEWFCRHCGAKMDGEREWIVKQ